MSVFSRGAVVLVLACAIAGPALRAQTPAVSAGAAQGVGFLQLVVNRKFPYPYVRAIFERGEQPYVEVNDLMQAVEISVRYEPGLHSASGYLPDGTTRFVLNVDRATLDVGQQHKQLNADSLRIVGGDLYVQWSIVPEWIPVLLEWNVQEYELQATTLYRLPSQDRAVEEARRQRLVAERDRAKGQELMDRPLTWFDPGMLELRAASQSQNDAPRLDTYTLAGVQRFIGGDLEYSVTQPVLGGASQDTNIDYARLNYYNDQRSFGVTAGQTFAAFSPLVLAPVTLQGATFFTGAQPERYGRTTLVGTAQPGSKVDLYRLGVLVDFTTVPTNGVYQFNNLPLGVGTTLFEIKVFAPDGRVYVEYQEISSQESMLPEGRLASQGASGYAPFNGVHLDVRSVESRAGLLSNLTLGGYAVNVQNYQPDFEPIADQSTVGAFLLWRPVNALVLTTERAQDSQTSKGANRLDAFLGNRFGTLEVDYRTYEEGYNPPARTRATQFSQNALLNTFTQTRLTTHALAVNLALTVADSDFGNQRTSTEYKAQLDRRFGEHLTVLFTEDDQSFSEPAFATSHTNVHSLLGSYSLDLLTRVEATFSQTENTVTSTTLTPAAAVPVTVGTPTLIPSTPTTTTTTETGTTTQVLVTYTKSFVFTSPWAYHATYASISHAPERQELGVGYLFKNNVRLNFTADSRGGWLAQLDYTLDFRLSGQGFEKLPVNTFRSGGVEGVVYVDENGDGKRQPNEPTLPDARIVVSGGKDTATDESGHYRTWGLSTQSPTSVELDPMSSDALYVPATRRLRTLVRPGEMAQVDIPIVPSNGVEGSIVHGKARSLSPAYGLRMVLEPTDRGVGFQATVEWDGSFVLEGLPPGRYTLYGDPQQLKLKGIRLLPESQVIDLLPSREPVWRDGIKFELIQLTQPARPAPSRPVPGQP